LLPPDADVVESDAVDEDGGDLLPERRRAGGAPAVAAARSSQYAPRFQFMTGALVAVGVAAAVGIGVAVFGISPTHEGPPWSPWKPTTNGIAGATQIASHVAPTYRDGGVQLVKVDATTSATRASRSWSRCAPPPTRAARSRSTTRRASSTSSAA